MVTIDPAQLAVAISTIGGAIVGLVLWLQRSQAKAVREQLDALKAVPPSDGLNRLAEEMGAERAARHRLAEQVSSIAVAVARLETDVRWIRRQLGQSLVSSPPGSRIES